MNQNVQPVGKDKLKRAYTVPECILAWLTYLCTFLFCKAFPVREYPLGGLALVILLYCGTAVLLAIKGNKLRA